MKTKERPLVAPLPPKDAKEREDIRRSFFSQLTQEITNAKLQLSFCSPESGAFEYWTKELQNLFKQKSEYGK